MKYSIQVTIREQLIDGTVTFLIEPFLFLNNGYIVIVTKIINISIFT